MKKLFILTVLFPLCTCGQQQATFQQVSVGPVGNLNSAGISAGALANSGSNLTGQFRLEAVHPFVSTQHYYVGETMVYKKPFALISVGGDLLYIPKEFGNYLARTYVLAGVSYGLFPQHGYVQAGGGVNSKVIDISIVYRLGFGRYQAIEGWTIRIVKPFTIGH